MNRPRCEFLENRRLLAFVPPADPRVVTNLDSGWKFLRADAINAQTVGFNDSAWSSINVPHTWNNLDGQDGGNNYYRGIGWYRRHITPAASLAGKSLYLKFDGANLSTDLYINGTLIGQHKGGFSAFGWDVSPYLTVSADNVIAVKVTNASDSNVAPLAGDYTQFGGIYRHVNLIATNTQHVALREFVPADTSASPVGPTVSYWLNTPGVYLKPTSVSAASANLSITTNVRNDAASAKSLTLVSDIVDAAGNLVTELTTTQSVAAAANVNFVQNTTIANPHLWNGLSDPYLYTVYVTVKDGATVTDLMTQPLGFRTFSVDPSAGAMLNGQYYDLHGVNFHQDRLNKGWAISDADQVEDVNLIQEMGSSFVRLSHYQHPQLTYDLLDQRGIAAWSEIPINGTGNANLPSTTSFLDNAKQQLQEMIRQNFNHPGVLVWGLLNEIADNTTNQSVITKLNNLAHQEDPTRPTTGASNKDPASQVHWIPDITGFNEYYGWYGGSYDDIAGWIDSVHATYPARVMAMSEYGAGAAITQHADNPPPPPPYGSPHPEEYQNLFHEAYWIAMKTRPFLWEKTIWNMFDFAADGRNEGDTPGRNDKGMITYDRQTRKDAFYFYKANWSSDPVLYITSRRFTSRFSSTIPVKIYANMDSVTLKMNGATIGALTSAAAPDRIFQWNNVAAKAGTNTIEVTGTRNGQTFTDSVTFNNTPPVPPLQQIPALTGTPLARINFQPSGTPAYSGYAQDNGAIFGARTGGQSYGWNADNSANTRDRNSAASPDQRYDTFVHMQVGGTYVWEIAVPNGTYDVHLVAGDPSYTDSTYALDLEGGLALSGTPTSSAHWIESVVRVAVTDGRLTLSSDTAGANNKIAYIDINATAFAHLDGSTLNLDFDGSSNPVTLSTDGFNLTATQSSTTYSFSSSSVSAIAINGSTLADQLIVNATIAQPMTFQAFASASLDIDGGGVALPSGATHTLYLGALTIAAGGRLDLADNDLVVSSAAYSDIRALVEEGLGGSTGIISSSPQPNHVLALFDNSYAGFTQWNGVTVSSSAIIAKYTLVGDMNIDGLVTGDDYTIIDSNLNTAPAVGREWLCGDANSDGSVTGDDYTIIDSNLGPGGNSASIIPSSLSHAANQLPGDSSSHVALSRSASAGDATDLQAGFWTWRRRRGLAEGNDPALHE